MLTKWHSVPFVHEFIDVNLDLCTARVVAVNFLDGNP